MLLSQEKAEPAKPAHREAETSQTNIEYSGASTAVFCHSPFLPLALLLHYRCRLEKITINKKHANETGV